MTHVLEFPQDLRVATDFRMLLAHEPSPEEEAVPAAMRFALFPVSDQQRENLGERLISTRLQFFRQAVKMQMPLQAADLALGPWVRELIPAEEWEQRQTQLRHAVENLVTSPVSVVAASRVVPIARWGADVGAQNDVLEQELDASLAFLNEFILSLGLVSRESRIRPLARGDLPALCPVIIEAFPMQEGFRVGTSFLRVIHEQRPPFGHDQALDERVVEAAATLTVFYRQGEVPFFLFYELMLRAEGSLAEHRYADAAISAGTAAEVLVDIVIRESSLALNEDARRREGVLAAPFANRVRDHLGRYLQSAVDLNDATTPYGEWWNDAYQLRNAVVHGGHKPSADEAQRAVAAVSAVATAIRDALRAQPETRDLGERLEWGPLAERRRWDEEIGLS